MAHCFRCMVQRYKQIGKEPNKYRFFLINVRKSSEPFMLSQRTATYLRLMNQ